jgi:arginyl-tRNA synthetase
MNDKQLVSQALAAVLGDALSNEAISNLLETPKKSEMGDLAFPAFSLAKSLRKAPNMIAADIAEKISSEGFEKSRSNGSICQLFLR